MLGKGEGGVNAPRLPGSGSNAAIIRPEQHRGWDGREEETEELEVQQRKDVEVSVQAELLPSSSRAKAEAR